MTMPTLKVTVEYELDRQDLARLLASQYESLEAEEFPETRAAALEWARGHLLDWGPVLTGAARDSVLHLALLTVNQLFPELRP